MGRRPAQGRPTRGGHRLRPRPTAAVTGGIQPDLLGELAEEAHRRDGFVDRLLACWPEAAPLRWTEATVAPATMCEAEALFARLRPAVVPAEPRLVDLTPRARRTFARWFDENAALVAATTGLAAGCFAKYPGQGARIALVLHCLRHPEDHARRVDEGTILDAIAVVEFFRAHLARVLPAFGAAAPAKGAGLAGRVARVLQRAGGAWMARTGAAPPPGRRHRRRRTHRRAGGAGRRRPGGGPVGGDWGARAREEWRWVGAEEPPEDVGPKNEEMKNSPGEDGNSSYLHIFGGGDPDADGAPVQETLL